MKLKCVTPWRNSKVAKVALNEYFCVRKDGIPFLNIMQERYNYDT